MRRLFCFLFGHRDDVYEAEMRKVPEYENRVLLIMLGSVCLRCGRLRDNKIVIKGKING